MLRSRLVRLDPTPSPAQLGGATGFILWPAVGANGQTWPVTLRLTTKRGDVLELLVRPGTFYRLGTAGRLDAASWQLPAASPAALYQLDLADEESSIVPGATP